MITPCQICKHKKQRDVAKSGCSFCSLNDRFENRFALDDSVKCLLDASEGDSKLSKLVEGITHVTK